MIDERYYFLFFIAFLYIIFATVQDLRKREVANWLNFSLLAFALVYRLFYSVFNRDYSFFIYGVAGFALFFIFANLFYYSRVFAGGDAKLLMSLGAVFPYGSFFELLIYGGIFILALLTFGAIYSLIYSVFLVARNKDKFVKEFKEVLNYYRILFVISSVLAVFVLIYQGFALFSFYLAIFIIFMPFIFFYLKAVESSCMIKYIAPQKLTEGDWLDKSVVVNGKRINKSIHGLSLKEIELLRKHKVKVWIKEGIPFLPAFLLAYVFMVLFFSFLDSQLTYFLSFLL